MKGQPQVFPKESASVQRRSGGGGGNSVINCRTLYMMWVVASLHASVGREMSHAKKNWTRSPQPGGRVCSPRALPLFPLTEYLRMGGCITKGMFMSLKGKNRDLNNKKKRES